MRMIYNIFIFLYGFALKVASAFNSKAKLWVNGRKNWLQKMQESIDENRTTFWVHCSSLGEFEQGKPVIEALKNQYPQHQLVLSFFSPSSPVRSRKLVFPKYPVTAWLTLIAPSPINEIVDASGLNTGSHFAFV